MTQRHLKEDYLVADILDSRIKILFYVLPPSETELYICNFLCVLQIHTRCVFGVMKKLWSSHVNARDVIYFVSFIARYITLTGFYSPCAYATAIS